MKFNVKNIYTYVSDFNEEEYRFISTILRKTEYRFAGTGTYFYKKEFFNKKYNSFPSGLLNYVLNECKNEGIHVELNLPTPPANITEIKKDLGIYFLKQYQEEAVKRCIEAGRGIVKAPTGSGKTAIIGSLIKTINLPALIIVDRNALMMQLVNFLNKYGINAQHYSGTYKTLLSDNTKAIVCTIQSIEDVIYNRKFDVLIVDECHKAGSNEYFRALSKIDAYYRYGFSASPFYNNEIRDMKIKSFLGEIIYELDINVLINSGDLSHPYVIFVPFANDMEYDHSIPYIENYKKAIVYNEKRNLLIKNIVDKQKGKKVILFRYIEHGKILRSLIQGKYYYVDGNTPEPFSIINEFNNDNSDCVLIASTVCDEGIDLKNIDCLFLVDSSISKVKIIQRIGRAIRKKETKNTVKIYDILDTKNPVFFRHAKARMRYLKSIFNTVCISSKDMV